MEHPLSSRRQCAFKPKQDFVWRVLVTPYTLIRPPDVSEQARSSPQGWHSRRAQTHKFCTRPWLFLAAALPLVARYRPAATRNLLS